MRGGKFAAGLCAAIVLLWAGISAADTLMITTESLPAGQVGVSYDAAIVASGDSESGLTWTVRDLPYSLNAIPSGKTCTISGIPDTAGTFTFTVTAANTEESDTKTFTLTIDPPDSGLPVTINPIELPDAAASMDYSQALTASGDPSSWSVTSGDLPPGLTLSSDGTISGVVSGSAVSQDADSAVVYSFDVTASRGPMSDTKTFSLNVYEPVRIATDTLPDGKTGTEYYAVIEAHGTRQDFTQSISPTDELPPGLEVNTSELGKMIVAGSPSIAGTYSIRVSFANFWGNAEKLFILNVEGSSPLLKPQITIPEGLDSLTAGVNYSFQYTAAGTEPITWSISGDIPEGLEFDPASATLSGTVEPQSRDKSSYIPSAYDFTVTAMNAAGHDTASSRVNVWYAPEIVTAQTLPDAVINRSYSIEITARGTRYSTVWQKVSGNLPRGLTLTFGKNSDTCTISGTPQVAGTFMFRLSAKNSAGISEKQFQLIVNSDTAAETGKPQINTRSLYNAETGETYCVLLEASGQRPITWNKSGTLPKGLKLDKYGTLSGIAKKSGTYHFTIIAKNSAGNDKKKFSVRVDGDTYSKPKITTKSIPAAAISQPYRVQLECTGTRPVTWTFANKKYPAGLYITDDGIISGTPKEAGTFTVKAMAGNSIGTTTKSYSLKVSGIAPSIITEGIPSGLKGVDYSSQLLADGTGPVKWSKSGNFPAGLKLNSKTGEITGKPKKQGQYDFKLTAKNKYGKDTRAFVVIVSDSDAKAEPVATEEYTPELQTYGHEELADIFVLSGDEELRGEIYAPEGKPLTFVIGSWPGGFEPDNDEIEIYIADEPVAIEVDDDGTFILPGELVYDEFVVYALADGMRTEEIYIVAEPE